MKNLEIKSKYTNHKFAVSAAKKIKAKYKGVLNQTDTYFNVKSGRLKMRIINKNRYELIHYHRANTKKERYSNYELVELNNGRKVYNVLKKSLGVKCVINKERLLYIFENVRIHIDTVKFLGKFLEFEVVCKTSTDMKNSGDKMNYLMKIFNIDKSSLVPYSYSDLLLKRYEH